jgi:hypothetical protein
MISIRGGLGADGRKAARCCERGGAESCWGGGGN